MDGMVEKLRALMGDEQFVAQTQDGALRKAEAQRKQEEAASLKAEQEHAAMLKSEEEAKTAATQSVTIQVGEDNPHGNPVVTVEHASMDEILDMVRRKRPNERPVGELAPRNAEFCPILAVSRYPYKYMDPKSAISDKVSKAYFANEKFWKREWSLYYIYPPLSVSAMPLILVPATEVGSFLTTISNTLHCDLRLDESSRHRGLLVGFPNEDLPRPRYLGISDSKKMFAAFETSIPKNMDDHEDSTGRSFEEWKKKIEAVFEATRNKNKRSKAKKQRQRVLTKTDWARQLRRLQRYLGLRESNFSEKKGAYRKAQTAEEQNAISNARALAREDVSPPNIDVFEPPLHPFDSNVVFVCIDVEVNERQHSQITEIGVASLDAACLAGVPPGKNAVDWHDKIQGRHFIIKEFAHVRNSQYVTSCPDRYEAQFGVSEVIPLADAPGIVKSCFVHTDTEGKPRPVVLVGHDIESDILYLRQLEIDLPTLPDVLEVLDSATLYRTMRRQENNTSLANVLYYFGIAGWNLHNAGNDAGYTLQALLSIAVQSISGEVKTPTLEEQMEKAKENAMERVKENAEEWSMAEAKGVEEEDDCDDDVDSDNGGVPLEVDSPPSSSAKKVADSTAEPKDTKNSAGQQLD